MQLEINEIISMRIDQVIWLQIYFNFFVTLYNNQIFVYKLLLYILFSCQNGMKSPNSKLF